MTAGPIALCQVTDEEKVAKDKQKTAGRFEQPIEELFLTDTLHPQDVGEFALHLISSTWKQFKHNRALVSAEYGVTERLQVTIDSPGIIVDSRWSFADLSGAALYTLMPNNRPFAMSVQIGFGSTDRSIGEARSVQTTPSLLAARAFGRFELHGQIAAGLSNGANEYAVNLGSTYAVGKWTPTLELNDFRSKNSPGLLLTPGLYYHFTKRMEFGIGVPIHLYRAENIPQVMSIFTVTL